MQARVWVLAIGVGMAASCGGGGSSGGGGNNPPGPTPVLRAFITGNMLTVSTARTSRGVEYTIEIILNETGGTAATMGEMELLFLVDGSPYAFSDWGSEAWAGENRIAANGTLRSNQLITIDSEPEAFATRTEARIEFTDDRQNRGTVTLTSANPALPPAPKHTLSGTVRSGSSTVRDVRIEVRTGANKGRSTRTDSKGQYRLTDLTWEWFMVRASKSGYQATEQPMLLSGNKTLNFTLTSGTSVIETATVRPERSSVRRLRGEVQ